MNFLDQSQKEFLSPQIVHKILQNQDFYRQFIVDNIQEQPQAGQTFIVRKSQLRKLKKQDGFFYDFKNWGGKNRIAETRKIFNVNQQIIQVSYANILFRKLQNQNLQRRIFQSKDNDIAIIQYQYKNNQCIYQEQEDNIELKEYKKIIQDGVRIVSPQKLDLNQNQKIFIFLKQKIQKSQHQIYIVINSLQYKCFYVNPYTIYFKLDNINVGSYKFQLLIDDKIKIKTNKKIVIVSQKHKNQMQNNNKNISISIDDLSFSQSERFSNMSLFSLEKNEISEKIKTIQKQVKCWISRNKYQLLKSTAIKLQTIYKKKKINKKN